MPATLQKEAGERGIGGQIRACRVSDELEGGSSVGKWRNEMVRAATT